MHMYAISYNDVKEVNRVKGKTCCFSGHRTIPEWKRDSISVALRVEIRNLILKDYRFFCAGGALDFDTMVAQMVLSLKSEFPYIKRILVLPCEDQASKWSNKDRAVYEEIKGKADKVVYIAKRYTPDCMLSRNRHLVDHSSACICYLTRKSGGTAYTVDYARHWGVRVMNLADEL